MIVEYKEDKQVYFARALGLGMASDDGAESSNEGYEIAEELKAHAPEAVELDEGLVRRHAVAAEYSLVCRTKLDGIYIIPSNDDIYEWFGVIFIRRGVFMGGILRFSLIIPPDFPETSIIPIIRFETEIFHPLIDLKTSTVDMRRFFPDGWKRDKHHIVNTLLVLQKLFYYLDVDTETCANSEASILWKSDKAKFNALARQAVDASRAGVYDDPRKKDDANCIRFTPWCEDEHRDARTQLMSGGEDSHRVNLLTLAGGAERVPSRSSGATAGFSWIDTDALTYMTEPADIKMNVDSSRVHSDRVVHGIERLDLSAVVDEAEEPLVVAVQSTEAPVAGFLDNVTIARGGAEGVDRALVSPGAESMATTTDDDEIGESHI